MTPQRLPFDPPKRETLCDKLERLFRSRRGQWIDLADLAAVAGIGGFRTRISDLRHYPYLLNIEQRLTHWPDGRNRSQYRLMP